MSFINSCYIKSTDSSIIAHLVDMGFKKVKSRSVSEDPKKYIYCHKNRVSLEPLGQVLKDRKAIFCGEARHRELLYAVAVMSNETDNLQWFYMNKHDKSSYIKCYNDKNMDPRLTKASVEDLKYYFNANKR